MTVTLIQIQSKNGSDENMNTFSFPHMKFSAWTSRHLRSREENMRVQYTSERFHNGESSEKWRCHGLQVVWIKLLSHTHVFFILILVYEWEKCLQNEVIFTRALMMPRRLWTGSRTVPFVACPQSYIPKFVVPPRTAGVSVLVVLARWAGRVCPDHKHASKASPVNSLSRLVHLQGDTWTGINAKTCIISSSSCQAKASSGQTHDIRLEVRGQQDRPEYEGWRTKDNEKRVDWKHDKLFLTRYLPVVVRN